MAMKARPFCSPSRSRKRTDVAIIIKAEAACASRRKRLRDRGYQSDNNLVEETSALQDGEGGVLWL